MDTQKTVRKYLWYDLIANLCFGLVTMINSLSSIIKTDALKTVVSTAGLINVIIFVVFTIIFSLIFFLYIHHAQFYLK